MNHLINLTHVSKTFRSGNQNKTVFKDINLTIKPGEFVVLRGNNGAGKTTLLKVILGLLKPTTGSAELMGLQADNYESKQKVGVVLQETQVPKNLKVQELIILFQSYHTSPLTVEEVLNCVKLTYKQNSFATELSGGQKQRLLFALALVGNPKLLILDEPTRNLDDEGYEEFWQQIGILKAKGITVLMVTNNKADWDKLDSLATRFVTLKAFQNDFESSQIEDYSGLKSHIQAPSNQTEPLSNSVEITYPSNWKILIAQLKSEFLQIFRTPLYLSILAFPLFLYVFSGNLGSDAKLYSIYISCALLIAFALQSLAGRISSERAEGWLKLIRSTSLSPAIYIFSKILTSLVICISTVALVLIAASIKSEFSFSFGEWISVLSAFCLSAIPIFGLSLTISYLVEPESLNTVNGFSFIGIGLAAGALPFADPVWVQNLIALSPIYHARMFILWSAKLVGDNYPYSLLHFFWLIWASISFFALAVWAYRRDGVIQ
jgi:ABC-2 type transport system ATP-binding protein